MIFEIIKNQSKLSFTCYELKLTIEQCNGIQLTIVMTIVTIVLIIVMIT